MVVGIWVYISLGGDELHPYIGIVVGFGLMFSSVVVCNEGFFRRLKGQTDDEYIRNLIDKGKAEKENYSVKSAITFDDLNTGCLCHIIEFEDCKHICLYGQYLYDYVEIDDDPELNQNRTFPTSEFCIIRKLNNSQVLKLEIGSTVIEETKLENVDVQKLYNLNIKLDDGEIINNISSTQIIEALKNNG